MNRAEIITELKQEYAAQAQRDQRELLARISEVDRLCPEIAEIRAQNVRMIIDNARAMFSAHTQEEREALSRQTTERGIENNARMRALLVSIGKSEDYLSEQYRCPICKDTGLVGSAPSRFCECFESRLLARMYEDGSMAGLEQQNFETFDLNVIPEANGQREQMRLAGNLCRRYADEYPNTQKINLLLTGQGGLGKTFLLNCVYARLTVRGKAAIRITAYRMFDCMRKTHLSQEDDGGFDRLLEVPALFIDDLGTEPMMRNVTVEYLFELLNERSAARRHTIIATNLTPLELKERYGERVSSRLLDQTRTIPVQLKGVDLRQVKP